MVEITHVVSSSDGTLYGPFPGLKEAVEWAEKEDEMLGDWHVKDVFWPYGWEDDG